MDVESSSQELLLGAGGYRTSGKRQSFLSLVEAFWTSIERWKSTINDRIRQWNDHLLVKSLEEREALTLSLVADLPVTMSQFVLCFECKLTEKERLSLLRGLYQPVVYILKSAEQHSSQLFAVANKLLHDQTPRGGEGNKEELDVKFNFSRLVEGGHEPLFCRGTPREIFSRLPPGLVEPFTKWCSTTGVVFTGGGTTGPLTAERSELSHLMEALPDDEFRLNVLRHFAFSNAHLFPKTSAGEFNALQDQLVAAVYSDNSHDESDEGPFEFDFSPYANMQPSNGEAIEI